MAYIASPGRISHASIVPMASLSQPELAAPAPRPTLPGGLDPLGLAPAELAAAVQGWGWPRFRAAQVFAAIHRRQIARWELATGLPATARRELEERMPLHWPAVDGRYASIDGTVRYLLRLADGERVEAVYLPDEVFDGAHGVIRRRSTLCISSQVGCPVNCGFCLTALLGLRRNLSAGEIVAQVLLLVAEHGLRRGAGSNDRLNLVFMGMGEPFLNYDAVMRSVRLLTDEQGLCLPLRRITISTAGIVAKIRRFAAEPLRPRLAISLNAASEEARQQLMPIHRAQGGFAALLAAARAFPLAPRERLTFEYVLLAGTNDADADADRLLALLHGIRAKVNLIAWNAGPELPWASSPPERVRAFQARLCAAGLPAFIRRPRGRDVFAACGQLSRRSAASA